jgi:hypothetical protein
LNFSEITSAWIFSQGSNVTILNCTFTRCQSPNGVFSLSGCSLFITNARVVNCSLFVRAVDPVNHSFVQGCDIVGATASVFEITGGQFLFAETAFTDVTDAPFLTLTGCGAVEFLRCEFRWKVSVPAINAADTLDIRIIECQMIQEFVNGTIAELDRSILFIAQSCISVAWEHAWLMTLGSYVHDAAGVVYEGDTCGSLATATPGTIKKAYAIATVVVFFFCFSVLFIGLIIFVFCKARNDENEYVEIPDVKDAGDEHDTDLPSD